MPDGSLNADLLLSAVRQDLDAGTREAAKLLGKRYPGLGEAACNEIAGAMQHAMRSRPEEKASLVLTAPPSFRLRARTTMSTVEDLIAGAENSILLTGYSSSGYFEAMLDAIIEKSRQGVFVKFFVNDIGRQPALEKLGRYRGRFLTVYDYRPSEDRMAALHAKVLSVDQKKTLITSANLSYHGQQGNVELGVLLESEALARQIDEVFTALIFQKVFVPA